MRQFLDLDRRFAIAHRGGARRRPENTLAAFDYAASLGVDAVELDIHLSRDGQPVVIHDPTLERTTNAAGRVAAHTADELARVDAGFRFEVSGEYPFRGQDIGVPTLESVLRRHPAMPFMIELKDDAAGLVDAAVRVVRSCDAVDRVLFGSFSYAALQRLRLAGMFITSASAAETSSALIRSKLFLQPGSRRAYQLFQVPEITRTGTRVVSPRFVRLARRAELPVQVWVVNDRASMERLAGWGVTGIISDEPETAVAFRDATAIAPGST